MEPLPLDDDERAIYEWQLWVDGHGESGQERLKGASVLVSRCGGLGGIVALELAAAGVGRLVLAHAGKIRPNDLNRQVLMTHAALGSSRVECAARRLRELNPRVRIDAVAENIGESNAERLVGSVDLVVDCAPIFPERHLLNRECQRQRKPMVECAMYELEGHLTTFLPGSTPCLACLYPENPPYWKREFPVFGAVPGAIGCLAAMEALKVICGFGQPLAGRLLCADLRDMRFHTVQISRRDGCPVCAPESAPSLDAARPRE